MGREDNFAADRAAGDAVAQVYPEIVLMVKHSRQFLIRVVQYLVTEAGTAGSPNAAAHLGRRLCWPARAARRALAPAASGPYLGF